MAATAAGRLPPSIDEALHVLVLALGGPPGDDELLVAKFADHPGRVWGCRCTRAPRHPEAEGGGDGQGNRAGAHASIVTKRDAWCLILPSPQPAVSLDRAGLVPSRREPGPGMCSAGVVHPTGRTISAGAPEKL